MAIKTMKRVGIVAASICGLFLGSFFFTSATSTLFVQQGGTGTTTAPLGQIPYFGASATNPDGRTYLGISTTTASCSGSASCSSFTILGSSPVTISDSGGSTGLATSSPVSAGNVLSYSATGAGSAYGTPTTTVGVSGALALTSNAGALVGGSALTIKYTGIATTTNLTQSQVLYSSGGAGVQSAATSSLSFTGPFTIANPIGVLNNGAVTYTGLATTSNASQSNLFYSSGGAGVANVATTSVTCSGTVSCTGFTVIGSSPITLTGSASGNVGNWFTPTTYNGSVVNATSTGLWFKGAPTSLIASSTFATNATSSTVGIGTNYQMNWDSANDYLDVINTSPTEVYAEGQVKSNLVNTANGAESTWSMVVDCTGAGTFTNQNWFDHTMEEYNDGYQAVLGLGASGSCNPAPLVIRDVIVGGNKNRGNHIIILPYGNTGFANTATSSIPTQAFVYIASSTPQEILEVDGTPGTTGALGTSYLTVTGSLNAHGAGHVGISSSSPMDTLSVVGTTTLYSNITHFGTVPCKGGLYAGGLQGTETCGNNNDTNEGVQNWVENQNAGANAWAGVDLGNDKSDNTLLHYAGMFYNSSIYSDTTFGTAIAVPNLFFLQNSDGPMSFITSTSTTNYQNWLIGGTATGNEKMRLTATGLGVGSTSPFAQLSVFAGGDYLGHAASTLFAIGSTTGGTATTTLFSVNSVGTTTLGLFGACSGTKALTTTAAGVITCGSVTGSGSASSTLLASDTNTFGGPLTVFTNGVGFGTTTPTTGAVAAFGGDVIIGAATAGGTNGNLTIYGDKTTGDTGTGNLVLSVSPTFTGTVSIPTIRGGINAGSTLVLEATSGAAPTTAKVTIRSGPGTITNQLQITGALNGWGVGTTTPFVPFQIATSSTDNFTGGGFGQFALTDTNAAANLKHWLFSSQGGQLTVGTTSDAFATSSAPALTIDKNGNTALAGTLNLKQLTGTQCLQEISGVISGTGSSCGTPTLLGIANGGTATTTFYNKGVVFYNSTLGTLSQASVQGGLNFDNTNTFLGIGTSSPFAPLSVVGAGGVVADHFTATSTTNFSHAYGGLAVGGSGQETYQLVSVGTNNTTGIGDLGIMGDVNLGTTDGNTIGFQHGQQANGGAVQTTAGWDFVGVSHTSGAQSTSIAFAVRNAGSFGEALRINYNKTLGVGTTTGQFPVDIASSTGPQLALSGGAGASQWTFRNINNNLYVATTSTSGNATSTIAALWITNNGIVNIGAIPTCSGTTNALGVTQGTGITCDAITSDARLKKNITPIADGLALIEKLNPVTYFWKDTSLHDTADPRQQFGFTAQNVKDIVPSAVGTTTSISPLTPDFTYTLDKTALIAPLVAAVQEQQREIANIQVGKVMRSVEENWQDGFIALLILYVLYNEVDKRRRK